jgi:hypothetical protein
VPEQPDVDQRPRRATGMRDERGDERKAGDHRAVHQRVAEAALRLRLREAEDDAGDPGRKQQQPAPVEPTRVGAALVGVQQPGGQAESENRHGDVDVEDPPPGDVVDDQAADDGTEDRPQQHRNADHSHHAPDAIRAGGLHEQAHPDGHDHPAAEALEDPEHDQRLGRPGQSAQR